MTTRAEPAFLAAAQLLDQLIARHISAHLLEQVALPLGDCRFMRRRTRGAQRKSGEHEREDYAIF